MTLAIFNHYVFWLGLLSLACLVAERIAPWRRGQPLLRPQFGQDLFWLTFNGWLSSFVFAGFFAVVYRAQDSAFTTVAGVAPSSLPLVAALPLPAQALAALVVADFLEWCVHNLLHRVDALWRFHRVHHSITTMDWIGNFRFHWMETVVYSTVKYLPLAVLGAHWHALLAAAVVSTAVGHLNHANLNISWGPLRFVLNSPRMHIWHHDKHPANRVGYNFAVVFSMWDWIFGTARMPANGSQPAAIGFHGQERVRSSLLWRFLLPFVDRRKDAG